MASSRPQVDRDDEAGEHDFPPPSPRGSHETRHLGRHTDGWMLLGEHFRSKRSEREVSSAKLARRPNGAAVRR